MNYDIIGQCSIRSTAALRHSRCGSCLAATRTKWILRHIKTWLVVILGSRTIWILADLRYRR